MYGMVLKAAQDLLLQTGGDELWTTVRKNAGLSDDRIAGTVTYDDALVFALVDAAASALDCEGSDILCALGRHWILYTGREGWGDVLDAAGNDMRSMIRGLDDMHARIQLAMPEMLMPSFHVVNEDSQSMQVQYRSTRSGLAPMVTGLFMGLAEHFEESWDITHTSHREDEGFDSFALIERVPTATSAKDKHAIA